MKKNIVGKWNAWQKAGILTLALVLIFSTGAMIFVKNLYDGNFPRFETPKYSGYLRFRDVPGYARSVVHFPSGKNSLTGYIFGEENTKGLIVIAPGMGEGVEHYLPEVQYFVDHGWRVFAFDYTGGFSSEGENSVGLPQARVDLDAAQAYIQSSAALNNLPVMLWGHSWGGYAVTTVLKDHSNISAVVSIASFNSQPGLVDEQVRGQLGALGYVLYPYEWSYQTLRFGPAAWVTALDGINSTDTPVMIIHGVADEAASYNGASIIAQRARITNPNVVYKTCSATGRNGHRNLFRSEAAVQYIEQKNQEFQALSERFDGAIPDAVMEDYSVSVDRFQSSERDADFMNEVNRFFENALILQSGNPR